MKKINKAQIAKRQTRSAKDRKRQEHRAKFGLVLQEKNRRRGTVILSAPTPPPFHAGAILAAVLGGSFLRR